MLFKKNSSMKEEPAQHDENKKVFDQVGSNVNWGKSIKENSRKTKGSNSRQLQVQSLIRLTARKSVPNQFEKFNFSIPDQAQAQSGTPA